MVYYSTDFLQIKYYTISSHAIPFLLWVCVIQYLVETALLSRSNCYKSGYGQNSCL